MAPHPAKVSPSIMRVRRQCRRPIPESHCLFHVLRHESWRDADIQPWQLEDAMMAEAGIDESRTVDVGRWKTLSVVVEVGRGFP